METTSDEVNGIDVPGLLDAIDEVAADPRKGLVRFAVNTTWNGGTRTETRVGVLEAGGERVKRDFRFGTDEPCELFGGNRHPNPQEYLMGAINACMVVGYVAGAAVRGITLEKLEIESRGALDLRGFLGIDAEVDPGYETLRYTVRIRGNGTKEQFRAIHDTVLQTSPNYFTLTRPLHVQGELVVE